MYLSHLVAADQHRGKSDNPKGSPFAPLLIRTSQMARGGITIPPKTDDVIYEQLLREGLENRKTVFDS